MNKWVRIGLLICLFGLLFYSDFIRDYFFKNTGFQIFYLSHFDALGNPTAINYTDSGLEGFFENYTISDLVKFKWFLTVAFSLYFMGLCMLISFLFYQRKEILKFTLLLYGFIFFSAGIVYLSRYFSSGYIWQENTYLVSMQLVHFLQSSLPTLFIVASFKIYLSYKESTVNK